MLKELKLKERATKVARFLKRGAPLFVVFILSSLLFGQKWGAIFEGFVLLAGCGVIAYAWEAWGINARLEAFEARLKKVFP